METRGSARGVGIHQKRWGVLHNRLLRKRHPRQEDPWWWLIPARMCEKLVGLGEVDLVGINDSGEGASLEVVARSRKLRPACEVCGGRVWSRGYRSVVLVDLPAFAVRCGCGCGGGNAVGHARTPTVRSDRSSNKTPKIGPERALLTSRAARWVTTQVGRRGRPVDEVAAELGCGWHTFKRRSRALG